MFAEIKGAIDSVKVLSDILEASKDLRNFNEMASALSKVNSQLLSATAVALASQEKQSQLSNRVLELENQLREIEDWNTQIQRYKLHEFPSGALAYKLCERIEQNEPEHYLCVTCVDKKHRTTLQPSHDHLNCHSCKSSIYTKRTESY